MQILLYIHNEHSKMNKTHVNNATCPRNKILFTGRIKISTGDIEQKYSWPGSVYSYIRSKIPFNNGHMTYFGCRRTKVPQLFGSEKQQKQIHHQ